MRWDAVVASVMLVGGCATAPVAVQPRAGPTLHPAAAAEPVRCPVGLGSLVDARLSTAAGELYSRAIDAGALIERLRLLLPQAGVEATAAEDAGRLNVDIVHVYGQGKSSSMSFTTVLRGRYKGDELIARGVHTGVNWAGSATEIERGLLHSFDSAAARLVDLLHEACQGHTQDD